MKNNRGFVLAETLVVTVFLAIIFTMIYQNFYPLIGEYEKRENYNDVDGTYSVYWLKNLIEDSSYNVKGEEGKNFFEHNGYIRFECKDVKNDSKRILCKKLVKEFEVNGCDTEGNHCDIFITYYRLGYNSSESNEEIKNKYKFKSIVKDSTRMKWDEDCSINGSCSIDQFCRSFSGLDEAECQSKYVKKKIFDNRFKDYVKSLPDYSTGSLNDAEARVIATFHHTNDNNDYYSYATIEIDRKLGEIKPSPYVPKYRLTYDCNNGAGISGDQLFEEKKEQEINAPECTKAGYIVDYWNEKADGSGSKKYHNGDMITLNEDKKLYAVWKKNKVKIKLKANGGQLAEQHGEAYTINNDTILKNGNEILHTIPYDESLGNGGLLNWNNATALNLVKSGYTVKSGAEWICEEGCKNANQIFSQSGDVAIAASEFCDATDADCTVTLKVNWAMKKPDTPSIYNPSGGNWVKDISGFPLTVSTTSPADIIGYWYYSYDKKEIHCYNNPAKNSYGKETYETTNFVAERNQLAYIKVCNKQASGPNDTSNCSDYASTYIRIDRTPPKITMKTKAATICSRNPTDNLVYTTPMIKIVDNLSGLKSFANIRNDRSSRADDTCDRNNVNNHFQCHTLFKNYNTGEIKIDSYPLADRTMFDSYDSPKSYSMKTSSKEMLIEIEYTKVCDFASNCTSAIYDEDGTIHNNGKLIPNEATGFMSCKKWSTNH